jgi:membrane dipeptidase
MDDPRIGLSEPARDLIARMDARGVVHDLSHLSQKATEQLLALTDRPVIASHSNARSIMGTHADPKTQRHLADETIREIGRRGGVVGINLLSDFLSPAIQRGGRASVDDVVLHIERVCELTGSRSACGSGLRRRRRLRGRPASQGHRRGDRPRSHHEHPERPRLD